MGQLFCGCGESGTCCGESVDARKSDNPYDCSYSPVVVAAGVVSEKNSLLAQVPSPKVS